MSTLTAHDRQQLIEDVGRLPFRADRAFAFPLGGSTVRALVVNENGTTLGATERSASEYSGVDHAFAAICQWFGFRPLVAASSLAGPVPARGLLRLMNTNWPPFDRKQLNDRLGFTTEWFNDGPAGYFGLRLLPDKAFAVIQQGSYEVGDPYGYAIFGTGLNFSMGGGREDGHPPFAAMTDGQWEFCRFVRARLGYHPEWEHMASGGFGFQFAGEFYLNRLTPVERRNDPFAVQFDAAPEADKGKVVTQCALQGHKLAVRAAKLVFEAFGAWLGAMAVSSQLRRIDICPGILGQPEMREFCLKQTDFLRAVTTQGRPAFSDWAAGCTIRVCLQNPELLGAAGRAAELLGAAGRAA